MMKPMGCNSIVARCPTKSSQKKLYPPDPSSACMSNIVKFQCSHFGHSNFAPGAPSLLRVPNCRLRISCSLWKIWRVDARFFCNPVLSLCGGFFIIAFRKRPDDSQEKVMENSLVGDYKTSPEYDLINQISQLLGKMLKTTKAL